ncbi:hypothetical protein QVD17_26433 [Tagetes erecta]|uniref:Uncharacterized protein n=1 Tax=Tagetes erecta TaxID=13708 RepID=A0AAD8K6X3_TARER|nr:hypothetical protein QVD17_26433 [Tagetes erecta]
MWIKSSIKSWVADPQSPSKVIFSPAFPNTMCLRTHLSSSSSSSVQLNYQIISQFSLKILPIIRSAVYAN